MYVHYKLNTTEKHEKMVRPIELFILVENSQRYTRKHHQQFFVVSFKLNPVKMRIVRGVIKKIFSYRWKNFLK